MFSKEKKMASKVWWCISCPWLCHWGNERNCNCLPFLPSTTAVLPTIPKWLTGLAADERKCESQAPVDKGWLLRQNLQRRTPYLGGRNLWRNQGGSPLPHLPNLLIANLLIPPASLPLKKLKRPSLPPRWTALELSCTPPCPLARPFTRCLTWTSGGDCQLIALGQDLSGMQDVGNELFFLLLLCFITWAAASGASKPW